MFNESRRALDRQAAAIDELRSRAGSILSAASIVAAFLGAESLKGSEPLPVLTWVAVTAFALCGLACAWVLRPREFTFLASAKQVIADRIVSEDRVDVDQLRWALAVQFEEWYDDNQRDRTRMACAISVSCLALVVEVGAWLAQLALR